MIALLIRWHATQTVGVNLMGKVIRTLFMAGLAVGLASPGLSKAQPGDTHDAGAVFVMTNAIDKNEVIAYRRAIDGTLQESGRFATGGRGSGGNNDPLESQGSLTLSQDHTLLFAVNAGSGNLSVFSVNGSNLSLVDKVISGGSEPNAVAQRKSCVRQQRRRQQQCGWFPVGSRQAYASPQLHTLSFH